MNRTVTDSCLNRSPYTLCKSSGGVGYRTIAQLDHWKPIPIQVLCRYSLTCQTPILPLYTLSFYNLCFFQVPQPSSVLLVTECTRLVYNAKIRPSLQANPGQSMVTTLLNVSCLDCYWSSHFPSLYFHYLARLKIILFVLQVWSN